MHSERQNASMSWGGEAALLPGLTQECEYEAAA
jgi:hypothetical protein